MPTNHLRRSILDRQIQHQDIGINQRLYQMGHAFNHTSITEIKSVFVSPSQFIIYHTDINSHSASLCIGYILLVNNDTIHSSL